MENTPTNNSNESEIKPYNLDKLDNELKHAEEFNNSDNSEDQTAELVSDAPEKKRNKLALKIGAAAVAVALVVVGGYQSIKMMTKPAEEVANTQGNRTQTESTQASNVTSEKEQSELTTKPVESTYASSSSNEATSNKVEVDANTNTTATEENDVNTTETEKTGEQLSSSLEIPAGLSTDEYGNAIVEALELWRNCGYVSEEDDVKLMENWMKGETFKLSIFAEPIAEKNAEAFTKALLVPEYEQNVNLVDLRKRFIDKNKESIMAHLYTELDEKNKDASYVSFDKSTVVELYRSDVKRSFELSFTERYNMEDLTSSDNTINQIEGDALCVITTTSDGVTEKISDFSWAAKPK